MRENACISDAVLTLMWGEGSCLLGMIVIVYREFSRHMTTVKIIASTIVKPKTSSIRCKSLKNWRDGTRGGGTEG